MLWRKSTECHKPNRLMPSPFLPWGKGKKTQPTSSCNSLNCEPASVLSDCNLINHWGRCGIDELLWCSFTSINLWFNDCWSLIHTVLPWWSICMMNGWFSRTTHLVMLLYIYSVCIYKLVCETDFWQSSRGWGNIMGWGGGTEREEMNGICW